MLRGAGNGTGDIELRTDDFARQPHLHRARHPALIDGGARGPHGRSEHFGARRQHGVKIVRTFQTTSARNDDLGVLKPHPTALALYTFDHPDSPSDTAQTS